MNVGIIVACVFTFPTFFEKAKVYVLSAATSIHNLLAPPPRKDRTQKTIDLPKDSFLQTHESTDSGAEHVNQCVMLHDVTAPRSALVQ